MSIQPPATAVHFSAKTIFLGGLLAGTLDILSAFIDYGLNTGKNPLTILNYIASGILGKDVIPNGGAGIMIAGLLLHYFIAFSFTIFFFWLCKRTNFLHVQWVLRGILYGIFIWVVMNLVVVQLSAVPHGPISAMKFGKALKAALILICMIGLPLSYIVYRSQRKQVTIPLAE